jgi:hypothetical protein
VLASLAPVPQYHSSTPAPASIESECSVSGTLAPVTTLRSLTLALPLKEKGESFLTMHAPISLHVLIWSAKVELLNV